MTGNSYLQCVLSTHIHSYHTLLHIELYELSGIAADFCNKSALQILP